MSETLQRRLMGSATLAAGFAIPAVVVGFWLMRLFPYHPGMTAAVGWVILVPAGLVASLLHGFPFTVAWIFGVLAEAITIFVFLGAWVFLRRKRARKPYSLKRRIALLSLVPINLLLAYVLAGYLDEMRPPLAVPTKLVPGAIKSAKEKLPRGMPVDFDYVTFARGKLYVASVIGLIEVDGTKLSAVYRWHTESRVDGVWSGPKGQSLWLQQAVSSDLSVLDDQGWRNVTLPTPERGYTRGDMLNGIKIAANDNDLWLSGGSMLWKWVVSRAVWEPVSLHGMRSEYESVEVYGSAGGPLVVKGANQMFGNADGVALLKPSADGSWTEIKLTECCVKDLTIVGDRTYFRSKKGALFYVSGEKLEAISAPGRVEAISADRGKLIASIADVGIFSFDGDWKKLFDAPYPSGTEESWAHLAAHDGAIALSITQLSSSTSKVRKDGLWVSDGQKMVKVEVPD